jgi:hypothetical protein
MSTQDFRFQLNAVSLGLISAGFLATYLLLSVLLDPCRSIPGPFIARFTKLWTLYQVFKGDYEVTAAKLHRKYGPIVRVQPGQYIVHDVATAKAMFQVSGPVWVKVRTHEKNQSAGWDI